MHLVITRRTMASYDTMHVDAWQWKHFDATFPEFGNEARNLWFTLRTDRMNLFGDLISLHNTWLVILSIYNLSI